MSGGGNLNIQYKGPFTFSDIPQNKNIGLIDIIKDHLYLIIVNCYYHTQTSSTTPKISITANDDNTTYNIGGVQLRASTTDVSTCITCTLQPNMTGSAQIKFYSNTYVDVVVNTYAIDLGENKQ